MLSLRERDRIVQATGRIVLPDLIAPRSVVRDASDDLLIALAAAGDADTIVTGDRDLLAHPRLHPPTISARTACALLGLPT